MAEYSLSLDASTVETIDRRRIILLDTSVWIELADKKTATASLLCDKLIALNNRERIFCPLTAPTIWELRKQSPPSLHNTAHLMETLSLNVSFRDLQEIFDKEVSHFLDYLRSGVFSPLSTSEKFGSLLSYLSPSFFLKPGPNFESNEEQKLYQHCAGLTQQLSLTQLISMLGERSFPKVDTARDFQANNKARREAYGSVGKMRRIEIEHIANKVVLPKLLEKKDKLSLAEQVFVTNKIMQLPRNRKYDSAIEHVLRFMPALSAYIEVLVASGLDTNRKDNQHDFFDREVLVYGLSYASLFSAIDSWIGSLVKFCKKSMFSGIVDFAGDLNELNMKLEKI